MKKIIRSKRRNTFFGKVGKNGIYYGPSYCYNIGTVTGTTAKAIIADKESCKVTSCYSLENVSEEDLKKVSTYESWDFSTIWTLGGDPDYLYPELQYFTLNGTITIDGDISYNNVVTPNLGGLNRKPSSAKFYWYIGDEEVHVGDSYKIAASDIGKKLSLKIISEDFMCLGYVNSAKYTVNKGTQTASPVVPEILYVDDKSFSSYIKYSKKRHMFYDYTNDLYLKVGTKVLVKLNDVDVINRNLKISVLNVIDPKTLKKEK